MLVVGQAKENKKRQNLQRGKPQKGKEKRKSFEYIHWQGVWGIYTTILGLKFCCTFHGTPQ